MPFTINVVGSGSCPSIREFEKGYCTDEGMDHVESEEHLFLANEIMKALRKLK